MAGQDVTPANFEFGRNPRFRKPALNHQLSLAGTKKLSQHLRRSKIILNFIIKDTIGNLAKSAVKPKSNEFKLLLDESQDSEKQTKSEVYKIKIN